jgi:hypothetical protein
MLQSHVFLGLLQKLPTLKKKKKTKEWFGNKKKKAEIK